VRLAYITTHYPALSHTFILGEVAALRREGAEVHTISMRRAGGEHLLSRENREASQTTHAIRPPRWGSVLAAHSSALARHPRAYLTTLAVAMRLTRPGPKAVLWQVFYFGQAIIVWQHCHAVGARHVHAHHASAPADVALLAARFGDAAASGPCTWSMTVHGPAEFQDVRWFALAEKARRARMVVCISHFARSQLMALLEDSQWDKLHVVRCGVTVSDYAQGREPAAARPQLLCVGRLVAEKGHTVLLHAVARVRSAGLDVETVFVGSGPLRGPLECLARELGIAEHVVFRGALAPEEVARCYAKATVFCSASFAEGVPVVLMEAMAARCPVIATAIAGVRELVRDGETGLLVTPGCTDELAGAITTLLRSGELRSRLSRAGREHVRAEFDIDRSATELTALFGSILRVSDRTSETQPRASCALMPTS